ncbi:hypothetical protein AMATHDRAFT_70438 [Amanita thiersii Skay4041]|uniref:Vacuolar-sorting protein SNF7 n=1 Tax=Amanita thiersii Skay4041 TaxID=703135 RepID=A0A2A9ND39_9AGAR|nr:hypothetical protein AMATHDRAFT_70438 [Amanita thiersii Skay4041]
MMASFMSYFGGRKDPKQSARDAIIELRQQIQMIDKKAEYLQKKIDEDLAKAKANAVSNKQVATLALKRKKASELEHKRLEDTKLQLEMQLNTLESANLNAQTMAAMKKAADALKVIHGNLNIDKVDATMAAVHEQRELANEIADTISQPLGVDLDEDSIKAELEDLEQEELNERLAEADHVPVHIPPRANRITTTPHAVAAEDDEEAQLKELQMQLSM